VELHPATRGFEAAAERYERGRPDYPAAAIDRLVAGLGLRPGAVVADVGAGTGKLTRQLVGTGARVLAVEPLEGMRAVLERLVPEAEALAGTAEALPLADASVDAATVGQAFHWFDGERALRELGRVVRPGSGLALVWNARELTDPLQARLAALLDEVRGEAPSHREQSWRKHVETTPFFGLLEERTFPWEARYSRRQLAERVASVSFVARLPANEREPLLDRAASLVEGLAEPVPFRYRTDVYVLRRRSTAL
jgi:ubiquinone/menaquinone biosynthesis C-methylase UbiE